MSALQELINNNNNNNIIIIIIIIIIIAADIPQLHFVQRGKQIKAELGPLLLYMYSIYMSIFC